METFSVGSCFVELLHPKHGCLVTLSLPKEGTPAFAETYFTREEAAHLAGILVHCVLQRAAPASAVKAFREMTIGELLEARAFPGKMPVEDPLTGALLEEEEPEQLEDPKPPPFPPGV